MAKTLVFRRTEYVREYYEVEWTDVLKWHTDSYRKLFMKAANDCEIQYRVSTHSLRKSFGWLIHKMHQYDPDCLITLQKLFNHSDLQTTMDYIGLSFEKEFDCMIYSLRVD